MRNCLSLAAKMKWHRILKPGLLGTKLLCLEPLGSVRMCHGRNSPNNITITKISPYLTLRQVSDSKRQEALPSRSVCPLVLMYAWANASTSALGKYAALYHDIGLDVLTIKGTPGHFLWPPRGVKLAEEVFEYIQQRPAEESLFVHAFSVGAYNYAICLQEALQSPDSKRGFRERVCGQVFDSIVTGTYDNMSEGLALLLPQNRLLKFIMVSTMSAYYTVTRRVTRDQYDRLIATFTQFPIIAPTLFFYSHNDPTCHVPTTEAIISAWQKDFPDMEVWAKSWKVSRHAGHFKQHRREYLQEWKELLKKAGML